MAVPFIIIILVFGLIGIATLFNFGQSGGAQGVLLDDFTLQDPSTLSEFNMSQYKGSLILIDFMFTDCPSCSKVYPELVKVHQEYPEVEIFTVTGNPDVDTPKIFMDYVNKPEYGIDWHVARDIYSVGYYQFRVNLFPTIVLIDKDFRLAETNVGPPSFATMNQWIANRL